VPCRDAYAHAKTAALRALAIDSCSADAQVALGTVLFVSEWDWKGARRSLERALATDPDHPEALLQYGAVRDALSPAGKAEGLAFKQRALERAPHSALVFVEIAISLQLRRDVEQAILWARRATEADPINIRASNLLAALYLVGGNIGAFLQERRRLTTVPSPVSRSTRWGEELAHARNLGRQQFLRLLLTALTGNSSYDDLQRAALYGALGDLDDAFCCLDRALGERDPLLVFLGVHPLWDSLRDDPRYKERIQAMGLIDDGAKQPQRHAHSA
jgi:serine/threonine-protein kinase